MHLLTQSALLRALGWSLFNSLWQMSLLWALYHLFLLIFKGLTARARHNLLLALLTAGFCWSAVSFFSAFVKGVPENGGSSSMMPHTSLPQDLTAILDYSRWLAGEALPWCSSLYLAVLCGLLVHYGRHYFQSGRIVRDGLSPLEPAFGFFVSSTAQRMGIGVKVHTYLSSLVEVPLTLGFLRPVILLPVSMVTQLTAAQIEAILVHELAHIRRKDYVVNLLVTIMELLYFFNPFTRLLIAQLKKEREHCCDDIVLEFQYDAHGYVSALLSLARRRLQADLAIAAVGSGEQLLLQRARKILQQKRTDEHPGTRPLIGFLLTALFSVMVLGHSLPGRINRPDAPPPPVPPAVLGRMYSVQEPLIPGIIERRLAPQPPAHHRPIRSHRHLQVQPAELLTAIVAESIPVWRTADRSEIQVLTPVSAFAAPKKPAQRDYSMGNADAILATPMSDLTPMSDPTPMLDNSPFVPQSSFSFQYTDTLSPETKLALMTELSTKLIRLQMVRIQEELGQQLSFLHQQEEALRRAYADESHAGLKLAPNVEALKMILRMQQDLHRQYRLNLERLQQQLQKASRHLTIVYI